MSLEVSNVRKLQGYKLTESGTLSQLTHAPAPIGTERTINTMADDAQSQHVIIIIITAFVLGVLA